MRQATDSPYDSDHLLELDCNNLLKGMFIADLDCPWSNTPFSMGGFHIRSSEDIEVLQTYCNFVIIDMNKGVKPRAKRINQLTILSSAREAVPASVTLKIDRECYPVSRSVKQEVDKAWSLYQSMRACMALIGRQTREGDRPDFTELSRLIEQLSESIIANPQTLIWILNTDPGEADGTGYCVRAGIWAAILARQTGMVRDELHVLFMGTLLADIGMHLLPERLVNKKGPFRKKEFLAYKKHVDFGLDLLNQHSELDDRVIGIVRCHHERHDGLGFPRGLRGEQIPILARFANLAYCYDRLLRCSSNAKELSPVKAMAKLYKQRVLKFPEQLAVEFIHLMGTYPIGSMVELNTGELAIVLEQNEGERLSPKVAILSDWEKAKLEQARRVDLSKQQDLENAPAIRGSYVSNKPSINNSPAKEAIRPEDYMFSFFGKKLTLGGFSLRF